MFLRLPLVLVLLLLISVAVSADTLETTYSIPSTDTLADGWTGGFNVAKYNPALGPLTSVELLFSGGITGTLTLTHADPGTWYVCTGYFTDTITLQRPDGTAFFALSPYDYVSWPSMRFGSRTFTDLSASGSGEIDPLSPADAALFTGLGSIYLNVLSSASQSYPVNPNRYTIIYDDPTKPQEMFSWANLRVRYNYIDDPADPPTPTPEPGTLALLGLGLPMAGAWLRRRRLQG
jgi:hypothetical protein